MTQDTTALKQKHESFVKTICESEIVIVLQSEEGFATSFSNLYEYDDKNPVELICFWSEKTLAESCINEDWKSYEPVEITLSDFIEHWCLGMHNDELLAGTNFDENLLGHEIEPLELVEEIIERLRRIDKDIKFNNFDGIDDLENQIQEIIN